MYSFDSMWFRRCKNDRGAALPPSGASPAVAAAASPALLGLGAVACGWALLSAVGALVPPGLVLYSLQALRAASAQPCRGGRPGGSGLVPASTSVERPTAQGRTHSRGLRTHARPAVAAMYASIIFTKAVRGSLGG